MSWLVVELANGGDQRAAGVDSPLVETSPPPLRCIAWFAGFREGRRTLLRPDSACTRRMRAKMRSRSKSSSAPNWCRIRLISAVGSGIIERLQQLFRCAYRRWLIPRVATDSVNNVLRGWIKYMLEVPGRQQFDPVHGGNCDVRGVTGLGPGHRVAFEQGVGERLCVVAAIEHGKVANHS